ncbi:MAG TPA: type II toxin-antitoxin system Phd/YefM family antitoxin [Chloroflexota bacterium]|nr:type II toxin-antitoxin system Phd/YefM family antitoxin [Chloroflexota bacterium]
MRQINIHEAKTHLSELVEDVARGDEIIIAKAGKPMARLVGLAVPGQPRRPGSLAGRITIAEDFDAPLPPEVLADFEGGA